MFSYSKKALLMFSLASVLILTSCAGPRGMPRGGSPHGMPHGGGGNLLPVLIIGGIIGGVIGHELGSEHRSEYRRVTATVVGTEEGMSVDGNIGRHMDEIDRIYIARSLETVRTDVASSWYNPDTGYEFKVVATRTFILDDATCRNFTVEATIDGTTEQIYDTACRQPDGSWKIKK